MKDKNIIKRGKVVELVSKQPCNGYIVRYGIARGKRSLTKIRVYANDDTRSFTYFNNGISAIKEIDNSTCIYVNNGEHKNNDIEDTLLVIVPFAKQLITRAEKIDKISYISYRGHVPVIFVQGGPFPEKVITRAERIDKISYREAVIFMHEGDTVELSQSPKGKRYTYAVVRNKNELLLEEIKG